MQAADVVIVGAGAAGLTAAIWAGRLNPNRSILILDGAKKPGAKILVAGGGRCNVTHDEIDVNAYAGSSPNAIKKVLRRFDVPQTITFFRELGVELKREETGKLFPVTDDARTVLNALLGEVARVGAKLHYPRPVESIEKCGDHFLVSGAWGSVEAGRVILATGGKSLPKSGSTGHGYTLAERLGHTLTSRITPALVPLLLPPDHFICGLSGLTLPTSIELRSGTGKKLLTFTNSTLCTHFGLSGPSILDISRYYLDVRHDDPAAALYLNWIPDMSTERLDKTLQGLGRTSVLKFFTQYLPERLVRVLCAEVGIEPGAAADRLTRETRRALAQIVTATKLPITGDRGYTYAEVTAGGALLSELRLETMESRMCAGLFLCGEICDVDGRIGGYNFQWAWSSGYVAGNAV